MSITDYILDALQKKYTFSENLDVLNLNYIESGYIDSLGIIQFVSNMEDEFDIQFTDDEISSPQFKVVSELIKLVESKVNQ